MAKKSNLNSGRSSGAAGTRPPAKTEGYAAVKAGFSQNSSAKSATAKMQGSGAKTATGTMGAAKSSQKTATGTMGAAKSSQKTATGTMGAAKNYSGTNIARANTPERIANRMATMQKKKGGK